MRQYITKDGDRLDAICWRYYGRSSGAVEAVLEANHKLAKEGQTYRAGLVIELPAIEITPETNNGVRLWD